MGKPTRPRVVSNSEEDTGLKAELIYSKDVALSYSLVTQSSGNLVVL